MWTMARGERAGGPIALGFSTHTGWAVGVAVQATPEGPRVLVRRRVELVVNFQGAESAEVYHQAAEKTPAAAERLVARATEESERQALAGIDALVAALPPGGGGAARAAGIVVSSGRLPDSLPAILRSHPFIHTAEGAHYRRALAQASRARGLQVVEIPGRELLATAAAKLRRSEPEIREALRAAGEGLGKPWAKDEKDATLAAWLAALD
jgi:hypothetical protein